MHSAVREELTKEATFGPDNETLTHSVGNCWLLCAKREEKVLPSTVVNAQLDEKVRQISEAEGRSVPRKEKQNLKMVRKFRRR